jgi:RNA polymerase sigma factor (sigma-70 family)
MALEGDIVSSMPDGDGVVIGRRVPMPNAAAKSAAAGATSGKHDAADARGLVFVIDDDESVRRGLDRLLRSDGLDVKCFSSPKEFVAGPLSDRLACVILDLRLPGASGLEVQETLARAGCELPIIFISGYADVRSSVRALKAGAVDFLQKPVGDQTLLDTIHETLDRARVARRERADRAAIQARFNLLSPRERDVLRLLLQGLLNKQIAAELGISEKTVKFHRARVMAKTEAGSVASLVRQAERIRFEAVPSEAS